MTHSTTRVIILAALTAGLSNGAHAAAAGAPKKAAAAKVSASQLFLRLDAIDKKMDELMKGVGAAANAKAPVVQMPGPGEGAAAKEMAGAFYNYGVYMRQASNARMAARVIRDMTVLSGVVMGLAGWESARDKDIPRTMNNAYKHYPLFSFGITTAVVGVFVGEIVEIVASRSEAQAAKALMRPLEDSPTKP